MVMRRTQQKWTDQCKFGVSCPLSVTPVSGKSWSTGFLTFQIIAFSLFQSVVFSSSLSGHFLFSAYWLFFCHHVWSPACWVLHHQFMTEWGAGLSSIYCMSNQDFSKHFLKSHSIKIKLILANSRSSFQFLWPFGLFLQNNILMFSSSGSIQMHFQKF